MHPTPADLIDCRGLIISMLSIKINLDGIKHLKQKLTNNPSMMGEIRAAWALLYRSFVRRRFDTYSKGGGDWPALAPSTLRRRRRGRGRGQAAILRDSGRLFASFQPSLGASGSIQSLDKPLGVEVFLGGTPLSTIASYHDAGSARLPQRQIMVEPPESEKDKMANVAAKIMAKHAQ